MIAFFFVPDPDENRQKELFCRSCGSEIWTSDVFCIKCGEFNPHFNVQAFKAENEGKVVREVREQCEMGHPDIQEDIENGHEEIYQKFPYCYICGKRLIY